MSIAAPELLCLAKELRAQGNETAWRCSISRAYYAAFHHADTWHSSLPSAGNLPGNPGGKHHDLAGRMTNPSLPNSDARRKLSVSAGYILRESHRMRVKADYLLSEDITALEAEQLLTSAERVVAILV